MGASTSKQNLATRSRTQKAVTSPSSGRDMASKRTTNYSTKDRRRSIDLELGGGSNHTTTTSWEPSEHSENSCHKFADCRANDRLSLAQALDDMEEISSHSRSNSSHDSVIYIVRSDKLHFKGTGIRRHSRRKRRRQNGGDNTRIVVLRQPMRHESTVMPQIQTTIKEEPMPKTKSTSKAIKTKTTVAPVTPVKPPKKSLNCKKTKNIRRPDPVIRNSTSTDFMVFEETSEDLLSVSLRRDFQPLQ